MLGTECQERRREIIQEKKEKKKQARKKKHNTLHMKRDWLAYNTRKSTAVHPYMRKESEYSPWQQRTLAIKTRADLYPTNLPSLLISFVSFC